MPEIQTPTVSDTPLAGSPSATAAETPDASASDAFESGSLDAHEAAFSPTREPDQEPVTDTGRDTSGRFQKQPRRRAASQKAEPDDVPAINALTARLKAIEEQHGTDITRQDGESERVFGLRRRAELLERLNRPAPAPAPVAPAPAAPVAAPRDPQPAPAAARPTAPTFPGWETWAADEKNAGKNYDDYRDEREEFRYQVRRAIERADEQQRATTERQRSQAAAHQARVTAAKATYADWDTVIASAAGIEISDVVRDAVLSSDKSADVQYWLGQHRDELAALVAESQDYSSSAVSAMRRYLESCVASAQRASSLPARAVAGPTGSAPVLVEKPAPRPPNPVRTGAVTTAEETPPGDDSMSLAAHESFFGKRRRA